MTSQDTFMPENNFDDKKMLEISAADHSSDDELNRLAQFMVAEPRKIPAGYTYLGQFINHDITLDSTIEENNAESAGLIHRKPCPNCWVPKVPMPFSLKLNRKRFSWRTPTLKV